MAFDWRKKLEEGKKAAGKAFEQASEKGKELGEKALVKGKELAIAADKKLEELDEKIEAGTNRAVNAIEDKLATIGRARKEEPKKDAPKGPSNG